MKIRTVLNWPRVQSNGTVSVFHIPEQHIIILLAEDLFIFQGRLSIK